MLGYQLYLKNNEYVHHMQWTSSNIEELKEKLFQQEITLTVEIPKQIPEMHFLQIKNKVYAVNKTINQKIKGSLDKEQMEAIIQYGIKDFDQYKYDPFISDRQKYFIYYQTVNDFPLFGAKIEVLVTEDHFISYSQNYFEITNKGLDRQVISAYSALRTALDQELIPEKAVIKQILLGYYGQTNQTNIQVVLTPVWKIVYQLDNKKDVIYVNAMTGGLEHTVNY